MRLVLVELTRLRSRRAVLLLLLAAVLLPAVVWAGTAWNTRPVSDAELAQVTEQIERDRSDPMMVRQYERCVRHPDRFGVPPGEDVEQVCDDFTMPQPEWYSGRAELSLRDELAGSGQAVVVLLLVLLMLIGTTFVGHDWNTGSMSNQLLFEPRRTRVWLAKGAAVVVTALVTAAVVLTAYWAGLWLLGESRGLDTPARVLGDVQGQVWRGLLLVVFAAAGSYALTMLFRSTVATLGVLFAAVIVGPLLLAVVGFGGYPRYLPHNNVGAVLNDGITYFDETALDSCSEMDPECGQVTLTAGEAGRYFGVLLVLAAVPSVASFRVRDVP